MNNVSENKITIAHLKKNEMAVIKHIDIEQVPLKLIELGCFVGSQVRVIEKANLGCPIYIQINNTYLSIRKDMASQIEIERI